MADDGSIGLFSRIKAFFVSKIGKSSDIVSAESSAEALTRRRGVLDEIDHQLPHDAGAMGVAFSGGGIRSATVSLGVAQELARHDRLLDFDYCSTVSGGGYFGSFLGAMFLPPHARGSHATARNVHPDILRQQSNFAHAALKGGASTREIPSPDGKGIVQNPVWWLREHRRYLAPDGGSDYFVAAAYMIRNWIGVSYVLALPIALLCLAAIALTATLLRQDGWIASFITQPTNHNWAISPLWLVGAAAAFLALSGGVAFWLTEYMTRHIETKQGRIAFPRLIMIAASSASITLATTLLVSVLAGGASGKSWTSLQAVVSVGAGSAIVGGLIAIVTLIAIPVWIGGELASVDAVIAEARRRFTRFSAKMLGWMLAFGAMALIDTLGMSAFNWITSQGTSQKGLLGALGTLLSSAIAWLIHKLPGMLSGKQSQIGPLLSKWISALALGAGMAMFLALTVSVHVLAQSVVFGAKWASAGQDQLWLSFPSLLSGNASGSFLFAVCIVAALMLMTSLSAGFINLSSIHGLYASRLTRAYVGASNMRRILKSGLYRQKGIRESDPGDQIPAPVYFRQPTAAPIHLVNVTLNETRSDQGSQLLNRDRKGVPLVFGPEGVWLDPTQGTPPFSWEEQARKGVEALSVGQLCAISGAAVSSAMGSRTTLGGALAFTLANIRLGYWWKVGKMIRDQVPGKKLKAPRAAGVAGTYYYLYNELRGSYSRNCDRINLSDGGHFENTGAYELLRREVKLILVCDNGADPAYEFEDLELLVRKARIDLGLSITVVDPVKVQSLVGKPGADRFLNGAAGDWRARAKPEAGCQDSAFALMLEAHDDSRNLVSRLVWLKPRCFQDLPYDVAGYAMRNPSFPQQSTGDQFFDEAQWESYRALGNAMIAALFSATNHGKDVLRELIKEKSSIIENDSH